MGVAQSPEAAPNQSGGNQQATSPQIQSEQISPEAEAALQQKVIHAIVMLPYYGVFDSIGYRLQGRTVTLTGQVLRSSLKPDAEHAVKKVEGIDKVINNIEVLPPGQIDMSIREQVRQAIYTYGPLFKYANMPNPPIRIIVKNARVTLLGVVDTEADKNLCTMRTNQVHDVLSVTNDLRVVKP
jgi:hyperosmotically inducible protein